MLRRPPEKGKNSVIQNRDLIIPTQAAEMYAWPYIIY